MTGDSVPAVLARLAEAGISTRWHDGKAIFSAAAEPPAPIVALIDTHKADISAFLHPDAVQRRLDAEADLLQSPPPHDTSAAQWKIAIEGLRRFLEAGHGAEAERCGWTRAELYRVPELWSQIHLCGVGLLIGDHEVVEVKADAIAIRTTSGAVQRFYRKPEVDYGLAYRGRIKMAGDDGLKEEVQLRALEYTVNVCRANTGADLEQAKKTVLAAIAGAAR